MIFSSVSFCSSVKSFSLNFISAYCWITRSGNTVSSLRAIDSFILSFFSNNSFCPEIFKISFSVKSYSLLRIDQNSPKTHPEYCRLQRPWPLLRPLQRPNAATERSFPATLPDAATAAAGATERSWINATAAAGATKRSWIAATAAALLQCDVPSSESAGVLRAWVRKR